MFKNKLAKLPSNLNKHGFDILGEFETLDTQRKMELCDQLFHSGRTTYSNTVKLLWPAANDTDATKLERFLRRRIAANR